MSSLRIREIFSLWIREIFSLRLSEILVRFFSLRLIEILVRFFLSPAASVLCYYLTLFVLLHILLRCAVVHLESISILFELTFSWSNISNSTTLYSRPL